jgi:hypothetical protein
MPDFRFYATKDESLAMLRDLFARGDLRAIVGWQRAAKPALKTYTSFTEELAREVGEAYKAHLFGDFSTHPPLFTKLTEGPEKGHYILGDDAGGPQVLFHPAALYDGRVLTEGTLWTQPKYQLDETQFSWPTPALKAAYADMVKRMKKHLARWEGIWITPGALRLIQEGKAQFPDPMAQLTELARKQRELPQLGPAVPATSRKTAKRSAAAKSARAE